MPDSIPRATGCRRVFQAAMTLLLGLLVSCAGPVEARVETAGDSPQKLAYRFESLTGVRDGDVLRARASFGGDPEPLLMDMIFRIGVPTRLESGSYRWNRGGRQEEGSISEVSVTFLGGQSDRPSLGGVFLLLDSARAPVGRVVLPTMLVERY